MTGVGSASSSNSSSAGRHGHVWRLTTGDCSLGTVLLAGSARGICIIALGDDAQSLCEQADRRLARWGLAAGAGSDPRLTLWLAQVQRLIDAPQGTLAAPLDIHGSAFQQHVWQALRTIAPGQTASYGDIAGRIGAPRAVRAVAAACAANPLAVAVPCHRVVRRDGELAGYRWGIERKRQLLQREAQASRHSRQGHAA